MYHDSRDPRFRRPTGAVETGGRVRLSVSAPEAEKCDLILFRDGEPPRRFAMAESGDLFSCTVTVPERVGIVWYYFEASYCGTPLCYGNDSDSLGGEGREGTNPYQITVYAPSVTPEWYKNGVVYQIFPDRFARGGDFRRRWGDKCAHPLRGRAKYLLSEDWDDAPFYTKRPDNTVTRWQFFGGTLEGIREKLPYLRGLGVTVLYLNPIFLAASNHRYDTADYFTVDPLLGDEESFRLLCETAGENGIRILLDGVFSHTGADSRYFNRNGTFPEPGAWQGEASPYYKWYTFRDAPGEYDCWWGFTDLPNVRELDPGFLDMICGENGVIRKWLRLGASGWRLDVADELPEEFIEAVRRAATAEKPDALILGEVWEDASNKVSYGQRRTYLLGRGLHSVMNYPFRSLALDFLGGAIPAREAARRLMSLWENYPPEAMAGALNLIGSHDRARALTVLGGSREKLILLWRMMMAVPGVPCLYYGDEAGLTGGDDPENRGTFPWGREDVALTEAFRRLAAERKKEPLFVTGDFSAGWEEEDVLILRRYDEAREILVRINRKTEAAEC